MYGHTGKNSKTDLVKREAELESVSVDLNKIKCGFACVCT